MGLSTSIVTICLVACHGGPAAHFADFAKHLKNSGYAIQVYAAGPAQKKFKEMGIDIDESFSPDNLTASEEHILAEQMAKKCSSAAVIISDVGHGFDIAFQKAASFYAKNSLRVAYYDNPEPFVPGGYSKVASAVMHYAERVFFANANLAKETIYGEGEKEFVLPLSRRIGLGYYPVNSALKMRSIRSETGLAKRQEFFAKHIIQDAGQDVLVYFGGNNQEYFEEAFPAFLKFMQEASLTHDLSNKIIVFQQHPGAGAKNLDVKQLKQWIEENNHPQTPKIVFSDWSSDEVQVIAGKALYHQTSMGPAFALSGIPTIQIGHKPYEDILVKNGLGKSVSNANDLANAFLDSILPADTEESKVLIYAKLGIRSDWFEIFQQTICSKQAEKCSSNDVSTPKAEKLSFVSRMLAEIKAFSTRLFRP